MTNGILRFNTNSPVEVSLRWDNGKRVEGRYGEQIMYTLEGDRVMYVPPVVAKQIQELGIRAREVFEICKAELREENKRWIEWRVRRIEEPRHPASSGNVSEAAATALDNEAQNHRNGSTRQSPRPLDLLTSLMMRFYDVTAGQILLDGVDLREHDLTELRQHFAVVLQDPFLFTGTIAENIRLGNESITEAGLVQAARDVNVLDFIESLPRKFD